MRQSLMDDRDASKSEDLLDLPWLLSTNVSSPRRFAAAEMTELTRAGRPLCLFPSHNRRLADVLEINDAGRVDKNAFQI